MNANGERGAVKVNLSRYTGRTGPVLPTSVTVSPHLTWELTATMHILTMTAHWGTWLICGARERTLICIIIWSVEEDGELEERYTVDLGVGEKPKKTYF